MDVDVCDDCIRLIKDMMPTMCRCFEFRSDLKYVCPRCRVEAHLAVHADVKAPEPTP
jgi:hypothetical protein